MLDLIVLEVKSDPSFRQLFVLKPSLMLPTGPGHRGGFVRLPNKWGRAVDVLTFRSFRTLFGDLPRLQTVLK